ncbi:hypothetical protein GE061_012962 [Apolygus lucorum]|uniref:Uncharacterized protein n=1 Tax=Apolygus lucorum TaxID=248454 RepID=A0A8S9XV62_APOLU|nr:hypothetical protein GE061_012962 [Apolygus lucorum]
MLRKFCFFLSLTTGTIIIGVLNVIYGIHSVIVQISNGEYHHSTNQEGEMERIVEILYTENSLYSMQFLFGFYLIYGTLKEKQTFIFASMLLHLAFVAYSSCFVAFSIITMVTFENSLPNNEQVANEALKIPFFMYLTFVIYGRHEELETKSPTLMEPLNRENNDSDMEEIYFS